MRGHVRAVLEHLDGRLEVLTDDPNFVLSQSKAYLINCTHDASATPDPVTHFTVGGGAASPANPTETIGSSGVDGPASLYMEYKCGSGSFFDAFRLSHNLSGNTDIAPGQVDFDSPTRVTFSFSLLWEEANGLDINEIGLVTQLGKLFCHKSLPTTVRKQFFNQLHVEWTIFLEDPAEESDVESN